MNHENHIGFRTDELAHQIRKAVKRGSIEAGFDQLVVRNGWIVGFLMHKTLEEGQVICQKDLECMFHLPKSTATDILQLLEKEGLIERRAIEGDARRKSIAVTEKGKQFALDTEAQIEAVEEYIVKDIDKEEMDVFYSVLDKLKENAINYKKDIV